MVYRGQSLIPSGESASKRETGASFEVPVPSLRDNPIWVCLDKGSSQNE